MTARQVFEATLIELSKVQAPSLKLHEFNYLFNKAINQYINKVYNVYDINQQTTDDLRVLKATAFLTPHKVELAGRMGTAQYGLKDSAIQGTYVPGTEGTKGSVSASTGNTSCDSHGTYNGQATSYLSTAHRSIQSLHGATYEVYLPIDYLHMLNCVCIYYVAKTKDCWDAGSYIEVPAIRLTADSWSQIVGDIYNRPSPMRPYYYIHNLNQYQTLPTDPRVEVNGAAAGLATGMNYIGNDLNGGLYHVTSATGGEFDEDGNDYDTCPDNEDANQHSNFQRTYVLNDGENGAAGTRVSLVEKPAALRMGNTSNVRCEIRYGKDDSLFQLAEVQIDYVKCPQFIRLTQEQIDLTEDTSQIMEFPDYVNQEITNELVHLVMERVSDPRLPNNMQMTQSIARPTGQQQAPAQAQQG